MKNVAIILGAGEGERFGSYKQLEMINNMRTHMTQRLEHQEQTGSENMQVN